MLIHILNDEKFSDWVVDSFEKLNPSQNRFFVVTDRLKSNYLNDSKVEFISKKYFLEELKPHDSDLFIFYFLHQHSIDFILKNKKNKYRKIWIGYGADYYYYLLRPPHFQSLYQKETGRIFKEKYQKNKLKNLLLKTYQILFFRFKVKIAISALDYFAPIIPNEFELVKKSYGFNNLKYLNFTFGDLDYLSRDFHQTELGNSILLNNSATYAGNHIDILHILEKLNCNNKTIIPVSYGNNEYKSLLIDYCDEKFPNQVELLKDFLPRDAYFEKIAQCGFVIMGHLRQQAMGNIYGVLYTGAKLFLFKDNPVYEFLMGLGVVVFTIEELELNPTLLKNPLKEEDKLINCQAISNYYSIEASYQRVQNICRL